MPDLSEQKRKANHLRKARDYKAALPIYRLLWEENGDGYDGAGLLHCLRKLQQFGEALPLADELAEKYPTVPWCRNEVIWTHIQGILDRLADRENLDTVIEAADRIMDLGPDGLAEKKVVFKVLKSAKALGNWEKVDEWTAKVDPDSLSDKPITDDAGRGEWSDRSQWYNYRIRALIETDSPEIAITLADEAVKHFPKLRKFFLRLKALAQYSAGNLSQSQRTYSSLCRGHRTDWWLLHEYSRVVRDMGRKEDALNLMCQAALSHAKLELMVSLFVDIGTLCIELGKSQEARAHLVLCKHVRSERDWRIPDSLTSTIADLNEMLGNEDEPATTKEALSSCQKTWNEIQGTETLSTTARKDERKSRKGLVGKVLLGPTERPFCFISKDDESFFCVKSDLPPNTEDGDRVRFDALPSFDKKKGKKSWKASNVRRFA